MALECRQGSGVVTVRAADAQEEGGALAGCGYESHVHVLDHPLISDTDVEELDAATGRRQEHRLLAVRGVGVVVQRDRPTGVDVDRHVAHGHGGAADLEHDVDAVRAVEAGAARGLSQLHLLVAGGRLGVCGSASTGGGASARAAGGSRAGRR